MKERPILFSAPMVRAILAGTKTQTRRIAKLNESGRVKAVGSCLNWHLDDPNAINACPYGQPGDRLWVRETWQSLTDNGVCYSLTPPASGCCVLYRATDEERWIPPLPWRPSIFMPRWASRITLAIENIRIERLNHISEADAVAEGVTWRKCDDFQPVPIPGPYGPCSGPARAAYMELWESINGRDSWHSNPFVWAITFHRI